MWLTRLETTGLQCPDCTIDFASPNEQHGLRRLTLLMGPNGIGKTMLLSAILEVLQTFSGGDLYLDAKHEPSDAEVAMGLCCFEDEGVGGTIRIRARLRPMDTWPAHRVASNWSFDDDRPPAWSSLDYLAGHIAPHQISAAGYAHKLSKLKMPPLWRTMDFPTYHHTEERVHFFRKNNPNGGPGEEIIPLADLSSGEQAILALLGAASNQPPYSILLIDGIEHLLSPPWQQQAVAALHAMLPDVQIICTTHSMTLAETFPRSVVELR